MEDTNILESLKKLVASDDETIKNHLMSMYRGNEMRKKIAGLSRKQKDRLKKGLIQLPEFPEMHVDDETLVQYKDALEKDIAAMEKTKVSVV